MTDASGWTAELVSARRSLARASTAEKVADILRDMVMEGRVLPGTKLAEDSIADALQVSRNTLREAFRLLNHERLVVHELNRGVFVRELTEPTSSTSTGCAGSSREPPCGPGASRPTPAGARGSRTCARP